MEIKTLTPGKKALTYTRNKMFQGYAALTAFTASSYLAAQTIALRHVEHGVWNPEAYQQSWGQEGWLCASLLSLTVIGVAAIMGTVPFSTSNYFSRKKTETVIDPVKKNISDIINNGNNTKTIKSNDYDAILGVYIDTQTVIQQERDIGTIKIAALQISNNKDDKYPKLETKILRIYDQESVTAVREELSGLVTNYEVIKDKFSGNNINPLNN